MTVTHPPKIAAWPTRDSQQRSSKDSKDITYDKSLRDGMQLARQLTITSSSSCVNRDVRDPYSINHYNDLPVRIRDAQVPKG